jgi:endonuclease YncB( thermonuclease family)
MLNGISPLSPFLSTEFESVDKTGGFIGSMYHAKTENVAVELVRAGLASIHAFTAEALPFSRALFAAEEEAKKGKKGVSRLSPRGRPWALGRGGWGSMS